MLYGGPALAGGQNYNAMWLDPKSQLQAEQNAYNTQKDTEDRDFAEAQAAADRANEYNIAKMPIDWQKEKYNRTTGTPLYSQLTAGYNPAVFGGTNTPQTPITQGPIWTEQQIQGQVNQSKANNAQQTATQNTAAQNKAAGSGFGSRSPLVAALQGQNNAAMMANNAANEQSIRWGAAEGNAQHLLDTQKAAEQQWMNWNQSDIERRRAAGQNQSSLLAALAAYT